MTEVIAAAAAAPPPPHAPAADPLEFGSPIAARFLLSDKAHKLWGFVTAGALTRFQHEFPEFGGPSENLHKLHGGIVLLTQYTIMVHTNMKEYIIWIDGFDYKGGAGNNEFASPIFHSHDNEIHMLLQRQRMIDVTTNIIDKQKFQNINRDGTNEKPFTDAVQDKLRALERDPRNSALELDAFVTPEQAQILQSIEQGFKSNRTAHARSMPPAGASSSSRGVTSDSSSAYLSSSQLVTSSQFDSFSGTFGGSSASQEWEPSQNMDEGRDQFSQHRTNAAPNTTSGAQHAHAVTSASAAAAAAAAAPSVATPASAVDPPAPVFSSTHLFLQRKAHAEKAAMGGVAPPVRSAISASNQAFVAAFGGVTHTMPNTNTDNVTTTTTKVNSGVISAPLPSSPRLVPPSSPSQPAAHPASPSKVSQSLRSPVRSPGSSSLRPDQDDPPVHPPSHDPDDGVEASLHNLPPPDSIDDEPPCSAPSPGARRRRRRENGDFDDDVEEDLMDGFSTQDSEELARVAQQESQFPFLTQAHSSGSDSENEAEPMVDSDPTPAAHAIPSSTYGAGSIEHRQAERRRLAAERLELEESAARAEAAAKEAAMRAEAARLADERRVQEEADRARREEARRSAEMAAARLADEEAAAAIAARKAAAAAAAAATHIQPLTQAIDATSMSDEEICILAAKLTESPHRSGLKRPRDDSEGRRATAAAATHGLSPSSALPSAMSVGGLTSAKRSRPVSVHPRGAPIAASVADGVLKAMAAMEAAQTGSTRARHRTNEHARYKPLTLTFAHTNIDTAKQHDTNDDSAPSAAASSSSSSSASRPVASPSLRPSVALPPFGTPFPISSKQVAAAVRYFHVAKAKRKQTIEPEPEPEPESDAEDTMDEGKESHQPMTQPEYSQWY